MISIQKIFYRKPATLGEGLARVKKSLGVKANAVNYDIKPGTRSYITKNGSVSIITDSFTEEHKCIDEGVKSWTDISLLRFLKKDKNGIFKTQYDIEYCINHNNVGVEATPLRYRYITKLDNLEYKTITNPTMYLYVKGR